MQSLIKPLKLNHGDKVAAVSLSWGGAGDEDLIWRYNLGKKRLKDDFGLEVVEMTNTLKGTDFIYNNPQKRAEDLMEAFSDKSIKAIFSCIGGDDSIRLLPYIDFEIIKKNPKIFLGYSDSTITHFMCLKAGVSSFYGPSILAEFAENVKIFDYTKKSINKTLFDNSVIGEITAAEEWTGERIKWLENYQNVEKKMFKHEGYEFLQGEGIVQGHLIGGCIEVLEMLKGTTLWPENKFFKNAILFFETSEDTPDPSYLTYWLRNYAAQGILQNSNGIIFGKPYQNKYYEEYKQVIKNVIVKEYGLKNIPIILNMNFGHTEPMVTIPYGALAEINCDLKTFSIIESGVL
jgi:muramoyltetrapeptide carboxypeptidase LdcA involved in peptidoglycan recycling